MTTYLEQTQKWIHKWLSTERVDPFHLFIYSFIHLYIYLSIYIDRQAHMVKIRLGYACINITLGKGVCSSRTATHKTIINLGEQNATKYLKSLAIRNIKDLLTILKWNEEHNIRFFRITSSIFPHLGDNEMVKLFPNSKYFKGNIKFAQKYLKAVGDFVKEHGHRITFHSHPYTQLGSPNIGVINSSLFDLYMYYKIFKYMGIEGSPYNCVILHGGGVYGNKIETLGRIKTTIYSLPNKIKKMLVFENDERHYNPLDLLLLCEEVKLPLCFDVFHNKISKEHVPINNELIDRIIKTWSGYTPKFHLSEQKMGDRFGAHSDYVTEIPDWIFKLDVSELDIMIECKKKELSVLYLFDKYPQLVDNKI
jgi:UV DNA damage endonuclease